MNKSERVKEWRRKTKDRIIKSLGGICVCCGNNSKITFDVHHLDPTKKEFSLSSTRANPKNWLKIVEELRKCVLVCSNCHREIHINIRKVPENCNRFNELYVNYKELRPKTKCPICGNYKVNTNLTCSLKCGAKIRYNIEWNDIELKKLIEIDKLPYTKIALLYNCSDNSIRKHYIKYCKD